MYPESVVVVFLIFLHVCTYNAFFHYVIPLKPKWKNNQFAHGIILVFTQVNGIIKCVLKCNEMDSKEERF